MASSQRWGRVTAGAAVVTLGLGLLSAAASADDTSAPSSPTISLGSSSPTAASESLTEPKGDAHDGDRGETAALGLWTEWSRTWLTGDGQYRSELFASPVNYRDEDSDWAKIDTTVVPSTEPGFGWQNQAGPVTVLFPKSLSAGGVRLAADDTWVSFALPAAAGGEISVTDSTVTYRQVWPGVDVQYQVLTQGVKETLVLADRATPRSFTFDIATSKGTVLRETGTGTISVINAAGQPVFGFGEVFAEDASGELATTDSDSAVEADGVKADGRSVDADRAGESEITSALSGDASGYQLQVALSDAWVEAEDRTWPIAVDPTVTLTTSGTGRDCYIDKAAPNTSFCSDSRIKVGAMSGNPRRGLLYFDPSGIPGSVVESAELRLWCDSATDNIKVQVHRGTVTIPGSNTSWTRWDDTADWYRRTGTTQWDVGSAGGGDFSTAVFGSRNVDPADCGAGKPVIPFTTGDGGKSMTELVSGWVAGTWPNDGMMVRLSDLNENANKRAQLFSNDFGTGTKAPSLQVISSRPSGLEGGGFQNVIAVNPTNPNIVVSGGDVSGISLSQDGGQSWTTQNNKISSQAQLKVASLVWQNATTIFALVGNGTTGGLLRGTLASTPSSEGVWITWTQSPDSPVGNGGDPGAGTGLPGDADLPRVKAFGAAADTAAVNPKATEHPRSVGRLLAIDTTGDAVYAGSYNAGLFRATLSTITTAPNWQLVGLSGEFIRSIDFDPGTNTLYAATYRGPNGTSSGKSGRVWRITNLAGTPTLTPLVGPTDPADGIAPTNAEELRVIGGTLYAVIDARHKAGDTYNNDPAAAGTWLSLGAAYNDTTYPRGLFRLPSAATIAPTSAWPKITHSVTVDGQTVVRPDVANENDPCGGQKNQIWSSLDGYGTGDSTTLWLGARNPACEAIGGQRVAIVRISTTDNWVTTSSAAFPTSTPDPNVLGTANRRWWIGDTEPENMLGGNQFTASEVDITGADNGTIYVAGRSGVWKSSDNGTTWTPAVRSLAVTINRDILLDPATNTVDIGNIDYRHITSSTFMNTVSASAGESQPSGKNSGLSAVFALERDFGGRLIAAVGARDANKGAVYWRNDALVWQNISFPSGVNQRPIGLLALDDGTTRVLVAALATQGLYQSTWNSVTSKYNDFTLIPGTPTFNDADLKRAAIIQGGQSDNRVYVYDNTGGVYRGIWNGGSSWNTTWPQLLNYPSTRGEGTGYLAAQPDDNQVIYVTTGGVAGNSNYPSKAFRISNARFGTLTTTDLPYTTNVTITGPMTVSRDGIADSDAAASIIIVQPPSAATSEAKIFTADPTLATNVAMWKSRTLDGYTSQALYPLDIAYDRRNGNTYIATNGNGVYTTYLPNPT